MTHIRLRIVLALATFGVAVWVMAMLWNSGNIAAVILVGIIAMAAAGYVASVPLTLTRIICRYVDAIEAGDTTTTIQSSDDPAFNRMASALNRMMNTYGSNCLALERSKLYYDRILRVMTHEMRNSITPVIALSADIKEHPERYRVEAVADAMEVIHDQSTGIKRFLDSYYDLTHLGDIKPTTVDAASFLRSIAQATAPFAAQHGLERGAIRYIVASGFSFAADRDLLARAVTNLLRNAIEATAGRDIASIEVTLSAKSGGALVTVADNGPGLDAVVERDLFQPFLTTKPGGAGIGLNLSRQIARLHGGDLILKSQPGRGVTAFLTIACPRQCEK